MKRFTKENGKKPLKYYTLQTTSLSSQADSVPHPVKRPVF
jgi:hypothetical protein